MSASEIHIPLAKRLDEITESVTLKLNAIASDLKAKGVDVINLTAGEPDFNVHEDAKRAVVDALERNQSKYTPVPGIPELLKAVAEKTNAQQKEIGNEKNAWKPENVIVSNGGKQALFNSFLAILNPGDEVLIPQPFWLSYPEMVKILGGVPRTVSTHYENSFKVTPQSLSEALGPKVRALVLNSPGNPTGNLYSKKEFQALAKVLKEHPHGKNVWIISDEIYDRIILSETPFCSFLDAAPELQSQTITINGLSKSAAMTGWRLGWAVAPRLLISALSKIQGQSTSGINSLTQWAGVAALNLPESEFQTQIEAFRRRKDLLLDILKKNGKIKISPPEGAFYAFIGIEAFLKEGEDSVVFCEKLLQKARVAAVPGTPFGAPNWIRFSFAIDDASLQEGCERFIQFLSEIEKT
jgi:aspartate aminotransferase